MGQWEVLDFFKKNKNRWLDTKDISEALDIRRQRAQSACKKLHKSNYIRKKMKIESGKPTIKRFKYKYYEM